MVEDEQLGSIRMDQAEAADAPAGPDPRILDDVLQRTILLSGDLSDALEDIDCLLPVAAKHKGKSLDAPNVLRDLVSAMLARVFNQQIGTGWDAMINAITGSLLEDPTALLRVEQLWTRLCSSSD